MPRKLSLPLGSTNFKKVSTECYYVDKTLLIKDFLDETGQIVLFTRPRRFGKTLNMDMLRTFFEKTDADTSKYFADKLIWQQGEEYKKEQGQYPVIFLSLKDIKASSWSNAFALLKMVIGEEYGRHSELQGSIAVSERDAAIYESIVQNTAADSAYFFSLKTLSHMLHAHYGKAPIIIIDEYDTPIQEGFINGYYNEAVEFIRNFFSSAFKDNPHMSRGILTGILRVAKESIFSGLNNIRVYSVMDRKFNRYFGFTTEEVQTMAEYYDATDKMPEIKAWYDGYKFGNAEIYNPWSVLYYFDNDCIAMPYWVQTSANTIIREMLQNLNVAACENLRALLNGTPVESVIETNTIYPRLREPQTTVLGFLLMTGYLKATETMVNEDGEYVCKLELPNREIRTVYRKEIINLLTENLGEDIVYTLRQALLHKDSQKLKKSLQKFLLESVSYYDGLKENYYHGLLLGMSVIFDAAYYPLSNRESGAGRYDIELLPKDASMPGIIIEIKAVEHADDEKLAELAQRALEQIENKQYDTEMLAKGIANVYKYGIAFCGKQVEVVSN